MTQNGISDKRYMPLVVKEEGILSEVNKNRISEAGNSKAVFAFPQEHLNGGERGLVPQFYVKSLPDSKLVDKSTSKTNRVSASLFLLLSQFLMPVVSQWQIKLYKTSGDMNNAFFKQKRVEVEKMSLNELERNFLGAVNQQRVERSPFIPMSAIDPNDRQRWRNALEKSFPGMKVTIVNPNMFLC